MTMPRSLLEATEREVNRRRNLWQLVTTFPSRPDADYHVEGVSRAQNEADLQYLRDAGYVTETNEPIIPLMPMSAHSRRAVERLEARQRK
jgi:hypothetical protein